MKGQCWAVAWPVLGAHWLHLCSAQGPVCLSRCSHTVSVLPDGKQGPRVGKMPAGPAPHQLGYRLRLRNPGSALTRDPGLPPSFHQPHVLSRDTPHNPGVSLFRVFLKNSQTSHLPRPAAPSSSCPEPLAQFPHCRPPAGPRQAMLRSTVTRSYCSSGEAFCFSALEPSSIHGCTLSPGGRASRTGEGLQRGPVPTLEQSTPPLQGTSAGCPPPQRSGSLPARGPSSRTWRLENTPDPLKRRILHLPACRRKELELERLEQEPCIRILHGEPLPPAPCLLLVKEARQSSWPPPCPEFAWGGGGVGEA